MQILITAEDRRSMITRSAINGFDNWMSDNHLGLWISEHFLEDVLIDTDASTITLRAFGEARKHWEHRIIGPAETFPLLVPPLLAFNRYIIGAQVWVLQRPPKSRIFRRPQEVTFHMGLNIVKDSDPAGTITTIPRDADGAETTYDDVPQWAASDATIVSLTPSADGTSCLVAYLKAGTATVSVTSLDNNGTRLTGTEDFQVEPGEAVEIDTTFTAGAAATPPATPPADTTTPTTDSTSAADGADTGAPAETSGAGTDTVPADASAPDAGAAPATDSTAPAADTTTDTTTPPTA